MKKFNPYILILLSLIIGAGLYYGYLKVSGDKDKEDPGKLKGIKASPDTAILLLHVDPFVTPFTVAPLAGYRGDSIIFRNDTAVVYTTGDTSIAPPPSECPAADYKLGPLAGNDDYYVTFNGTTRKFELYRFDAPYNLVCTCSVPEIGIGLPLKLKVISNALGVKSLSIGRGAPASLPAPVSKSVTGLTSTDNKIINFVKNPAWPPPATGIPSEYKIVGSSDDRDIIEGVTLLATHDMIFTNLEQDFVYIQHSLAGGLHKYTITMAPATPATNYKEPLSPANIDLLRDDKQKD